MDARGKMHPLSLDHHRRAVHVVPQREIHWFAGLAVLALGMAVLAYFVVDANTAAAAPMQTFNSLHVASDIQVAGSSKVQFLTHGTATVKLSTTSLPTQTQIVFPVPALKLPKVLVTLQQSGTLYTGLSFSVTKVTKTGFTLLVDAVRHGTVSSPGEGDVVLDRVAPLTEPLAVNWMAIV